MSEQVKKTSVLDKRSSRRTFIKNSGLTVGGVVLGGALGSLLINKDMPTTIETHTHNATVSSSNPNEALMYLTLEQYAVVEAAAERIFPEDELGPGAKSLGVAMYIDHQLASPWGLSAKEYMTGPFKVGTATQGYQGRQKNAEIFMMGLTALENYTRANYENASFNSLTVEQQDAILMDFENTSGEDKVIITGITSNQFFNMLKNLTLEGLYSDPMYGGNKNMGGWKLKNYPGHQMSFKADMEKEKFIVYKPQSLSSMY